MSINGIKHQIIKKQRGYLMAKRKSIDYIFGMITGASLMLAFWECTGNDLVANTGSIQEVKVVNESWDAVYVRNTD